MKRKRKLTPMLQIDYFKPSYYWLTWSYKVFIKEL